MTKQTFFFTNNFFHWNFSGPPIFWDHLFFCHNFILDQNLFWTQDIFDLDIFSFYQKVVSDPNFFSLCATLNSFLANRFFDPKIFNPEIVFNPKLIVNQKLIFDQICFLPKNCLIQISFGHNFALPKMFFEQEIVSGPNMFFEPTFGLDFRYHLSQYLLDTKYLYPNFVLIQNLCDPKLSLDPTFFVSNLFWPKNIYIYILIQL